MLKTISEILSNNIRLRREAAGATQIEFAISIEMVPRTYQSIESGDSWPRLLNLEAIARGLNVHPKDLLIDPDEPVTVEQAIAAIAKAHGLEPPKRPK